MVIVYYFLAGLFFLMTPSSVFANALGVQAGSTSTGSGGPNSLGIPPRSTDLGFTYLTQQLMSFNINISGLTLGKRYYGSWGSLLELGGGLIIDANGLGAGPYAIFGMELFRTDAGYALNLEYSQSLGLTRRGTLISPYILRLGFYKWF